MAEETPKNLEQGLEKALAKIKKLTSANAALRRKVKRLEALLAPPSDEIEKILQRTCINCGMAGRTTYNKETEQFECSACKYVWTMEAEEAPFRAKLA